MVDCGVKRFDDLPGRVGLIDVDYLRWRLYRCDHPSRISMIPFLGWLLTPGHSEKNRREIVEQLERAYRKHRGV